MNRKRQGREPLLDQLKEELYTKLVELVIDGHRWQAFMLDVRSSMR